MTTITVADATGVITAGTLSSTVPTAGSFLLFGLSGQGAAGITIPVALSTGSLAIEGSEDGGTNYTPLLPKALDGTTVSPFTGATFVRVNTTGLDVLRVRALSGAAFGNGPISVSVQPGGGGTDSGSSGGPSGAITAAPGSYSAGALVDGADVAQGSTTDAATANTVIGRLKKLISLLPAALGAAPSANSLPVVLASDQASLPVSSTPAADVVTTGTITTADTAVGGTGAALAVGVLAGQTPTAGSFVTATLAGQGTVAIQMTPAVTSGALVVEVSIDGTQFRPAITAPGVVWSVITASTIRVDVGGFTRVRVRAVVGTAFGAGNVAVRINATVEVGGVFLAGGTVNANPSSSTGVSTSVNNATSNTVLLAANGARRGATIFNDDTVTTGATLKVALGSTATATAFTYAVPAQGYYEVPFGFNGAINGIASAATGSARVTELS